MIFTFVLSFMDINESHEYASKHFPVGSHFSFLYIGYCNCFILRWKTRKNNKRLLFCISEVCFYNWIYPSVRLSVCLAHNALISKLFREKSLFFSKICVIKLLIIKYFHFIDNCTVLFYQGMKVSNRLKQLIADMYRCFQKCNININYFFFQKFNST